MDSFIVCLKVCERRLSSEAGEDKMIPEIISSAEVLL